MNDINDKEEELIANGASRNSKSEREVHYCEGTVSELNSQLNTSLSCVASVNGSKVSGAEEAMSDLETGSIETSAPLLSTSSNVTIEDDVSIHLKTQEELNLSMNGAVTGKDHIQACIHSDGDKLRATFSSSPDSDSVVKVITVAEVSNNLNHTALDEGGLEEVNLGDADLIRRTKTENGDNEVVNNLDNDETPANIQKNTSKMREDLSACISAEKVFDNIESEATVSQSHPTRPSALLPSEFTISPAVTPTVASASSPLSELSDDFLSSDLSGTLPHFPTVSSSGDVSALFKGDPPFHNGETEAQQTGGRGPRSRLNVEAETEVLNLSDRIAALKEEKRLLEEQLKREQDSAARLAEDLSRERTHTDSLEQELTATRRSLDQDHESLTGQLAATQQAARAREHELSERLMRAQQLCDVAQRDKDKMVVRYAQSEKAGIDAKKEVAAADRRVKDAVKEKDMMVSKVNHLVQERNRLSQQLEAKMQESKNHTRDSAKLREEMESRDVRIKWLQNKMKQEADSYKDGQLRMETLLRELREAQDMVHQYKQAEDSRSTALDRELREEKARRLVEEKLKQDSTHKERALASQLQQQQQHSAQLAQQLAETQERALTAESSLEAAQSARDRLQQEVDSLKTQVEGLLHDSAELDEQKATLQRERERVAAGEAELAILQASLIDLQSDLDACHAKEADLLDFTQKLTEKNVLLQSQLSGFQARAQAADFESRQHSSRLSELEARLQDVTSRLAREQEARNSDNQLLTRRLAERTRQAEHLTKRAEDAENETAIVRKKHHSSVRELQRELASARRRCAGSDLSLSAPASSGATPAETLSHASSSGSLTAGGATGGGAEPAAAHARDTDEQTQHLPQVQVEIPDRTALIERIVKLQRQVARRNEKIDFLQDHNSVLVDEVRRKSRLLQHYVLREETGAMTSQSSDQAKSDLMRRGGIMASIYGSQSKDTAMTLDLSLDINRKLQSVLEDTLLKNITLKDNMNVLGEEIATLTNENRKLKQQQRKPPS